MSYNVCMPQQQVSACASSVRSRLNQEGNASFLVGDGQVEMLLVERVRTRRLNGTRFRSSGLDGRVENGLRAKYVWPKERRVSVCLRGCCKVKG